MSAPITVTVPSLPFSITLNLVGPAEVDTTFAFHGPATTGVPDKTPTDLYLDVLDQAGKLIPGVAVSNLASDNSKLAFAVIAIPTGVTCSAAFTVSQTGVAPGATEQAKFSGVAG